MTRIQDQLKEIDTATDEIAADLQTLRDKLAEGTVATEEDLNALDDRIARLKSIGKDNAPA
jgi:hypothetical protein